MNIYDFVNDFLESQIQASFFSSDDFVLAKDCLLSSLTTFKTGGKSVVLFPKREEVLYRLMPFISEHHIPYFILGNGSNVLAKDEGYEGLIISLMEMKNISVSGHEITAQSGASITHLASVACHNNLTGMEFFYGIPGSVGGAVFMNAGAYGGECKDILKSVTYISPLVEVITAPTADLSMGYRDSIFQRNGAVILSAVFSLNLGNFDEISATMKDLMGRRIEKQPLEYPSAGSTFRRYEGRFTAKMIEEAGLKGVSVGGAMVSKKHAGFIINYNNATSDDIFRLIQKVKDVIFEKEKIHIECEVRIIE